MEQTEQRVEKLEAMWPEAAPSKQCGASCSCPRLHVKLRTEMSHLPSEHVINDNSIRSGVRLNSH